MPDAEVTFNGYPAADRSHLSNTGILTDTPAARAALEGLAIPKCQQWRQDNPEVTPPEGDVCEDKMCECWQPAPYCCSAYCPRCAGMRALDGVEPITPNQWMENA